MKRIVISQRIKPELIKRMRSVLKDKAVRKQYNLSSERELFELALNNLLNEIEITNRGKI